LSYAELFSDVTFELPFFYEALRVSLFNNTLYAGSLGKEHIDWLTENFPGSFIASFFVSKVVRRLPLGLFLGRITICDFFLYSKKLEGENFLG
jgi:hypothetical protein